MRPHPRSRRDGPSSNRPLIGLAVQSTGHSDKNCARHRRSSLLEKSTRKRLDDRRRLVLVRHGPGHLTQSYLKGVEPSERVTMVGAVLQVGRAAAATTPASNPGPEGHSEEGRGFWSANHAFTEKTLGEDFRLARIFNVPCTPVPTPTLNSRVLRAH